MACSLVSKRSLIILRNCLSNSTWARRSPLYLDDADSQCQFGIFPRRFSAEAPASEHMNLIKQLRERTSSPIKDVKAALIDCNWDIEAAQKELRKRGKVLASKMSARTAAQGLLALAQNETKAAVIELNCETDFVARNDIFQYLASSLAKLALSVENPPLSAAGVSPVGPEYLEDLKMNFDHPKFSGETTVQNAITEVAAMMGENVRLRRGFLMSTPNGIVSTYLHTCPRPGLGRIAGVLSLEAEDQLSLSDALQHVGSELAMHVVAAKPLFLTRELVSSEAMESEREILRSQAESTGKSQLAIEKMVEGRLKKYVEEVVLMEQKFVVNDSINVKTVLNNLSKEVGSSVKIGSFFRMEVGVVLGGDGQSVEGRPHRILLDTDVDTDDFFAILYLLKLNRSEFDLQAITINTNAWTNAGHAVNQVYDLLYMMGRDDIPVGVGGEGGIREDGTILPNVGGYLPIIEQGLTTTGGCRYRQAIPKGRYGGILDIDSNYGIRKAFLPQGSRKYHPLQQPTAQQVMIDTISSGPINVFVIGGHTNFAIFLMNNPHLKKNIKHIYVMGGGVRSKNPTGCCPKNASSTCKPRQCGDPGNLFTGYTSNPYAEFNIFGDPFAAYLVLHSGIPLTLVPLDATNTIPIDEEFFDAFDQNQKTYEAQYCFKSLKMTRDTWFDDQYYTSYFMWDSFTSGIATSIMRHSQKNHHGENEFAEMEYMNITVVTSNKPYGISDGSNPFFDGLKIPKFNLKKGGVHSGHVQKSLQDPFCLTENGKGRCKDGYTMEVTGPEGVRVLVATKAKPNQDAKSPLEREFYKSFLDVLNSPEQSGRFKFTNQFPYFKEVFYKPDFGKKKLGKNVIFDMDMSAGDFLALFFLLKVPVEVINLKAILVSPTGWANAATIDIIYDLLHMMGRDDIPVGLGDVYAMNQSDPIFSSVGDCKYVKAIPHGSGGFLDSDTLYGFARHLPRSPRRYTAENSVKFGAPRDTDHPELRQPLALDVWDSVLKTLDSGSKITILTNGPLTTLANIILSRKNTTSLIQDVYVVGGHISHGGTMKGNVFSVPLNEHAELNMYLDPFAAKTVFESDLDIKLIPLRAQRRVSSFPKIIERLCQTKKTPEALFARRLLSTLHHLQEKHHRYRHMHTFLGEILGAVVLADDHSFLNATFKSKPIKLYATGDESMDGQLAIDEKQGKLVKLLRRVNPKAYYDLLANRLGDKKQSAVIASFEEQKRIWTTPPNRTETSS